MRKYILDSNFEFRAKTYLKSIGLVSTLDCFPEFPEFADDRGGWPAQSSVDHGRSQTCLPPAPRYPPSLGNRLYLNYCKIQG